MHFYLMRVAITCILSVQHVRAWTLHKAESPNGDNKVVNTNHIFNAIHSAMRQWGSSLNHNGMSFFLATVPAGTQFYHGTHTDQAIVGMEWLAFEPEHAINFARGRPPGKHPKPPPLAEDAESPSTHHHRPPPFDSREGEIVLPDTRPRRFGPGDRQEPIGGRGCSQRNRDKSSEQDPEAPPEAPAAGWLHTYRTNKDLHFLYVDGTSAGKTDKGTLDSQDYLLLNSSSTEGRGVFWEGERAKGLCELAEKRWSNKIQGIIRMEAGFEIIMCSFEQNLEFLYAVRAGHHEPGRDGGDQMVWWIKAITARYDGIGGNRVQLDYDNFVTLFSYDFDLFRGQELPRLQNLSASSLDLVRADVDAMVQGWRPAPSSGATNWQAIADMIVERYAKSLKYLVSGVFSDITDLHSELDRMVRTFIDSDAPNATAEAERCAIQFLPSTYATSLAGRVVHDITSQICSTLCTALRTDELTEAIQHLESLITYLDWTTWKQCQGCELNEICFIPIWPVGSAEDRENPQCLNSSAIASRRGYWGGFGPHRGRD